MFKVAGPLWAQATAGGDNVFARLIKTGKKVLRRVLQQREIEQGQREIPKPTWTLRSHTVNVADSTASGKLVGGLFPRLVAKSQAAELRRQAALRLIRDARKFPVFAFVGLSLGVGASVEQKKGGSTEDVLCSGIRDLFQQYGGKERLVEKGGQHFSLQTLQLGPLIGQGCNAAVFEARPVHTEHAEDRDESEEAEVASSQETSNIDQVPETVESQAEPSSGGGPMEGADDDAAGKQQPSFTTETTSDDDEEEEDDDDFSIISEDDDDEDFCIISEEEEAESEATGESLEGWVLYRLSSVPASAADKTAAADDDDEDSDSDSDIIILARDEGNLESLPDFEDVLGSEFRWSAMFEARTDGDVGVDSAGTESETSGTDNPSVSRDSTLSPELTDSTSTTGKEPEPAPNIGPLEAEGREFPLAVKMMYNYNVESRADHIYNAMVKETVPALSRLSQTSDWQHSSLSVTKRLPPHPNIVTMYDVFVDQTPDLPEGQQLYPCALPPRLNKDGGLGRNATMFLVMKRYNMTLNEFLSNHSVDVRTRCLLFAQLLEGVAHLSAHGIAHRDLKSNNVLVDLSEGTDFPHLAISDFGSCLADSNYGLKLPYLTTDTDKGGNSALMAPEIKCAEPGPGCVLDYSQADVWAAGSLAYEIFGEVNPFYSGLDSRTYCDEDLPQLPDDTPEVVVKLVAAMLKRNPSERPSPAVAATCLELFLWAPPRLSAFSHQSLDCSIALWRLREISHWLESLTMETVCHRVFGGGMSRLDLHMKSTFLSRVSRKDILGVVAFEG